MWWIPDIRNIIYCRLHLGSGLYEHYALLYYNVIFMSICLCEENHNILWCMSSPWFGT